MIRKYWQSWMRLLAVFWDRQGLGAPDNSAACAKGSIAAVFFHELTDKAADFTRGTGIHVLAQLYKGVALGLVQPQNKLAVFLA